MTLIVKIATVGALTDNPMFIVLVVEDGPMPRSVHSLPGNYSKSEADELAGALEVAFTNLGHDVTVCEPDGA